MEREYDIKEPIFDDITFYHIDETGNDTANDFYVMLLEDNQIVSVIDPATSSNSTTDQGADNEAMVESGKLDEWILKRFEEHYQSIKLEEEEAEKKSRSQFSK